MMRVLAPLMGEHGFSVRFEDGEPVQGMIHRVGVLAHVSGHSVRDSFIGPRDDGGEKSIIQGFGSTRSFAERYILRALFNLTAEIGGPDLDGHDGRHATAERRPAPPVRQATASDTRPITSGTKEKPGQLQRFHAIVKNSDRNPVAVKTWLKTRYGYDSSAEIKRCDYEAICEAIAASGPLPLESREPGSDDE
jgi:hypothetical protein